MGYFCDGRASLVVGTHTHVPTADHQILPGGTAYMSDAGMTGDYDFVIGMAKEEPLHRFLRKHPVRRGSSRPRARRRCAASRSKPTTRPGSRAASAPVRLGGRLEQACPPSGTERFGRALYFLARAAPIRHGQFIPTRGRERAQRGAMAGHSQFKNIMHRKGRQDAVKSKLFGKLAREITVSAKLGLPDPGDESAAARGDHRGARGEHAQGQHRARHQEGGRRRGRELRRDPLRGLRAGRGRGDRRGA